MRGLCPFEEAMRDTWFERLMRVIDEYDDDLIAQLDANDIDRPLFDHLKESIE